jgi:hypothetical protein
MILLLGACTPDPQPDDTADTADVVDEVALTPQWTAEEAFSALGTLLEYGVPGPRTMMAVFETIFAQGDSVCPGGENWLKTAKLGCEADSGWWFSGIGGFWHTAKTDSYSSFETIVQFGDMEILGTEGERLAVGGHWIHDLRLFGDHWEWFGEINGSWRGKGFGVDWLEDGTSAWLEYGGTRPDGDELLSVAALRGGLAIGALAVHFDDLLLTAEGCDDVYPSGTISVLDPSGGWYRLTYPGDCTSCGQLTFADEVVAEEYCVDLSALRRSMSEQHAR